jgi:Rho-binding antiterminator
MITLRWLTYQYPICLTLTSGEIFMCCKDTSLNNEREECIKVAVDGADLLVVLDKIMKMEANADNPHLHQYHLSELGESQNEHQRFSCHRFNMIMIAILEA